MSEIKLSDEQREALNYALLDDATKVICHIEEKAEIEKSNAWKKRVIDFVVGFFSGVASTIAVEFLLPVLQQLFR